MFLGYTSIMGGTDNRPGNILQSGYDFNGRLSVLHDMMKGSIPKYPC